MNQTVPYHTYGSSIVSVISKKSSVFLDYYNFSPATNNLEIYIHLKTHDDVFHSRRVELVKKGLTWNKK